MKKFIAFVLLCTATYTVAQAQKIKLLKNIRPGSIYANPEIMAVLSDGSILFVATDDAHGRELWRSDGTTNGTYVVKDIYPGKSSGMTVPNCLSVNGKVYFFAKTPTYGYELWETDGTTNGTKMVVDLNPGVSQGVNPSYTSRIIYYNNRIYFVGNLNSIGVELCSTDGTAQGTQLVKNINPSYHSSLPESFKVVNGKLFFTAKTKLEGVELWTTDGTTVGTKMVKDLSPGIYYGLTVDNEKTVAYNNKLYFHGTTNDSIGVELYSSDGNSISLVKNINTKNNANSNPSQFTVYKGMMYFAAENDTSGNEIWKSDGTEQGTVMLKDTWPGEKGGGFFPLGELKGKLVYMASDSVHGVELWMTDGTEQGTKMIADVNPGIGRGAEWSHYYHRALNAEVINPNRVYNNVLYFAGNDGVNGRELWRTDGTDTGTYMVDQVGIVPDSSASTGLEYIFVDSNNVWLTMHNGNNESGLYLYKARIPAPPQNIRGLSSFETFIEIYPNPNTGLFTIVLGSESFLNGLLQVFDMSGKEIYNQSIDRGAKQVSVGLGKVPLGIYHVKVTLDRRVTIKSINIQ